MTRMDIISIIKIRLLLDFPGRVKNQLEKSRMVVKMTKKEGILETKGHYIDGEDAKALMMPFR